MKIPLHYRVVDLALANKFVGYIHRHHDPDEGHKFSIGCFNGGGLVGVAMVGRPKARMTDQVNVLEVTRVATDGTKNACSILYAAAARAAEGMGMLRIQTFILDSELGTSLRASGWVPDGESRGGAWAGTKNAGRACNRRLPDLFGHLPKMCETEKHGKVRYVKVFPKPELSLELLVTIPALKEATS